MSNVGSSAAAPRAAAVAFSRVAVLFTAAYLGAPMRAAPASPKIRAVVGWAGDMWPVIFPLLF